MLLLHLLCWPQAFKNRTLTLTAMEVVFICYQMSSYFFGNSHSTNLKIIKFALYFMTVICCNTNTNQRIPFRGKISREGKVICLYSHNGNVSLSSCCTKKTLKQHDDLLSYFNHVKMFSWHAACSQDVFLLLLTRCQAVIHVSWHHELLRISAPEESLCIFSSIGTLI